MAKRKRKRKKPGKAPAAEAPKPEAQAGSAPSADEAQTAEESPAAEPEAPVPEAEAAVAEPDAPAAESDASAAEPDAPSADAEAHAAKADTAGPDQDSAPEALASSPLKADSEAPTAAEAKLAREADSKGATPPAAPTGLEQLLAKLTTLLEHPEYTLYGLGLLAIAAYVLTVQVPFLFDDAPVVTRNRMLWSWDGAWTLATWKPTRWLTNLTFLVNFQFAHGGAAPQMPFDIRDWWSYHVVSIALHTLNGLLLFEFVRSLLRAQRGLVSDRAVHWVAWIGAAIWIVHPANTMAVSYIAQRYALLAATAILCTVVLYVRLRLRMEAEGSTPGQNLKGYAAVLAGVVCCLLTKENVAIAPVILVLIEVFFFGARQLGASAVFFAPHALGTLVFVGAKGLNSFFAHFLPPVSQSGATRLEYFLTEVPITLRYLHLWFLPYDMTVEQSFPIIWDSGYGGWVTTIGDASRLFWTAVLGHVLIVGLGIKLYLRGLRLIPFAIAWFYVLNVVESSFIPILDPMVDHRMYLPLALLGAALVAAVARSREALIAWWPQARLALPLGAVALLAALFIGTQVRVQVWSSSTGIWEDTVAKRPDCARAYSSLGMEHLYNEDWMKAIGPIETALQLGAYHVEGWNNLGKAYLELELWREAERALLKGIQVHRVSPSPSVRMCWNNVGLVYLKLADEEDKPNPKAAWLNAAVRHLRQATRLDPMYEVAYLNLADAEFRLLELTSDPDAKARHAAGVVDAVDKAKRVAELRGGAITGKRYRQRLLAQAELGQAGEAISVLVELLKRLPEMRSQLVVDAGDVAMTAYERDDKQAQKVLRVAAQVMDIGVSLPNPPVALILRRGEVAAARGERDAAVAFLQRGLERAQSPKHQALLDELLKTAGPGR